MSRFAFAFDRRFRMPLALVGVTQTNSYVEVSDELLDVSFGRWRLRTPLGNIASVHATGPYRWYRAIGIRLSLTDRGLTLGTNVNRGLCVLFRDPVPGLAPLGRLRHPGLTVTVADVDSLAAALRPKPVVAS